MYLIKYFTILKLVEDCKWDVQVNKSKPNVRFPYHSYFTNSEYERLLSCDLINLKSCPVETQRYFALNDWVKKLPWLKWSGSSLKTYFNGIISKANAYKEKIGFVKTTLKTFSTGVEIKNNQSWWIFMYSNQFNLKCLNGTNFEIGLECTPKPDRLTYTKSNTWSLSYITGINKVNFTFYQNANKSLSGSIYFDPSLNSDNSGLITSIFAPSDPKDIYTGSVELFTFICITYYNIYFF